MTIIINLDKTLEIHHGYLVGHEEKIDYTLLKKWLLSLRKTYKSVFKYKIRHLFGRA